MIKVLHSADWHMDAPLRSLNADQAEMVRKEMLALPGRIARIAQREACHLMLLSGDIFDGPYSKESLDAVRNALGETGIPVFIAPGNHDPYGMDSPWFRESWPENVHVFTTDRMEYVCLPELDCRVYGAAFHGQVSESILKDFYAAGTERYALAVLHGDPTSPASSYNPVTKAQIQESGLDYLALGHIHAEGMLTAGGCTVGWPGCPMGKGFDETGEKGVLIVTLDQTVQVQFCPVEGIRFHSLSAEVKDDPVTAAEQILPAVGGRDIYRITFTGETEALNLEYIRRSLDRFPNLTLTDNTVRPVDLWGNADEDSLEGTYFRILQEACRNADEETAETLKLAAKISRKILSGQEVVLP